ncbi:hypothetical protein [Arthrobacter sp. UYCu712]|uniref:hypothetical protein n=1 Tax=Arthrobacter sp. UYCu712 TaxID=3156340 RepID=UPI003398DC91
MKHPDRLRRPDAVELRLVADLALVVMRLQLFDLLDLPNDALSPFQSYGDVNGVVRSFERNGLMIDGDGKFIP